MTLDIFDLPPIALYRLRRLRASFTISLWHRNLAGQLTLASCALAGALATSTTPLNRQDGNLETTALDPVRNVTVVYRQVRRSQTNVEQAYSQHPYTEQVEASDQLVEDNDAPLNFSARGANCPVRQSRHTGRHKHSDDSGTRVDPASDGQGRGHGWFDAEDGRRG